MSGYIINMMEIAQTYPDPDQFYDKNVCFFVADGLERMDKELLAFFEDIGLFDKSCLMDFVDLETHKMKEFIRLPD